MLCRAPQSMKTIKESPLGRGKRHRRWGGFPGFSHPPRRPQAATPPAEGIYLGTSLVHSKQTEVDAAD